MRVAFALNKTDPTPVDPNVPSKPGRFARLLGKKTNPDASAGLPTVDIVAGVNRALRKPGIADTPTGDQSQPDLARDALSVIESTLYAIDTVRDIIEQACEIVISAQAMEEIGGRALLAERFDELRLSINEAVENSDPHAAQLIGPSARHLDVALGGKAHYSISPTRLDIDERGLNISPPRDAFATFDEITEVLSELDIALRRTDRAATGYCCDAKYLIARMKSTSAS